MADSLNVYDPGIFSDMIQSNYEKYKDMFATSDTSTLGQSDFLTLMIEQMKNQDITNPTDNSEFIAQMAQFSTLQVQQQVMELQKQMMYYSKAAYASSLVGKDVTVASYDKSNNIVIDRGIVESLRLVDGDFVFSVNGVEYSSDNIMSVNSASINGSDNTDNNTDNEGNDDVNGSDNIDGTEGGDTSAPETEEENGKTTYTYL